MTKDGYGVEIGQSFDDLLNGEVRVRVIRPDGVEVYRFKKDDLTAIYESIEDEVLKEASKRVLDGR